MKVKQKLIELAKLEMTGMSKRQPTQEELNAYFAGCGGPWKKADTTTSWCGIFATYLLRKAGAKVRWVMSRGIYNLTGNENSEGDMNVYYISGNKGITIGDIAVRDKSNHHFIVLNPPDEEDIFECVEGNYGGVGNPWLHQGKNDKNKVSRVNYYYRVI